MKMSRGIDDEGMKRVAERIRKDADAFGPEDQEPGYAASVDSLAQDLKEEFLAGDIDDMHQRVWEDVDGSQWIIYYGRNMDVLEQSRNSDAIDDAGVEISTSGGWRSILAQVAFFAMEADLWEALGELGWDGDGFGVGEEGEFEEGEF